ncbi:MAG: 4Fe-4S double cluster binding domain-containing protein [Christensenellaceae bacterium]|jgi:epoxyqueuosine reductase
MIQGLQETLAMHGRKSAVVPFTRIEDLKRDMISLKNDAFHTDWMDRMILHITSEEARFMPKEIDFTPLSIITVIKQGPKVRIPFMYQGKEIHCVLPPYFSQFYESNDKTLCDIQNYLTPYGFSAITAVTVPQKMLAVHTGLAQYGRNNICYNEEFGSYLYIMSYFSDMPCEEGPWLPLSRMEICETCEACIQACPTDAIDEKRKLIDANHCIVYSNELPGAFPAWITAEMHNSLVGCMLCQDCCPMNAKNEKNIETSVGFTEAETMEILQHKEGVPWGQAVAEKLRNIGISPEHVVPLPRNLAALLEKEVAKAKQA